MNTYLPRLHVFMSFLSLLRKKGQKAKRERERWERESWERERERGGRERERQREIVKKGCDDFPTEGGSDRVRRGEGEFVPH